MHCTYILYSESTDQYYTGYTSLGVEQRLRRHNNGAVPSTRPGVPWKIKYCRQLETKTEAVKWENFIKRQKSRVFIEKLIDGKENEWK
ncbi:MAG TPA: GIY-YIG nuclease family protein [Balneolaceae bacterium]|nr:GIY-YIG nuclease family protein [Balneolaceae bacterium]